MGLIRAISGAVGSELADQWKEFFTCDSLSEDILLTRAHKVVNGKRSSNTKGQDNVITNGSVVSVADGQFMIIVDQGKIVEYCGEPGQFTYDTSTEPSLFSGSFGESLKQTFAQVGKRFTFGGDTPRDQRVYFINTKEITGNKFGTAAPVPFRVVDTNIGLDVDISIRCNGEYTFKIVDPLLFYTNVTGNVEEEYNKEKIMTQMKAELLTALQPAFSQISAMGIRYSLVPGHTEELTQILQRELSEKWTKLRGLEIASVGINAVKASEEDEQMIKELQRTAVFRNAGMAAANLSAAQADAMKMAASNESTGPMMAFAGMNMAMNAGGMNANQLFQMDQQNQMAAQQNQMYQQQMGGQPMGGQPMGQQPMGTMGAVGGQPMGGQPIYQQPMGGQDAGQPAGAAEGQWFCPQCGFKNVGAMFCPQCGTKKPF